MAKRAKRQVQRGASITVRQMDHERGDHIPPHGGFASRRAELAVELRVARQLGVTDPARVSGDIMTREKEAYLARRKK